MEDSRLFEQEARYTPRRNTILTVIFKGLRIGLKNKVAMLFFEHNWIWIHLYNCLYIMYFNATWSAKKIYHPSLHNTFRHKYWSTRLAYIDRFMSCVIYSHPSNVSKISPHK